MVVMNKPYAYAKMESEDGEEVKHRRAQFLIYKSLQKADGRKRPSWLRVKMFKLKIKIGRRLKKGFSLFSSKHLASLIKSCKHLLHAKNQPNLHSIF
ncbi:hypothetical protein SASPL_146546 [Salvia splendens]|uniref:Uncharacterized protein n=1 Tax=Salvia splendens TaxID=180675 RepID=A0A8X8WDG9_SALSN|nr:hypothetical protein SASPL_146546 [Salvia splendens]